MIQRHLHRAFLSVAAWLFVLAPLAAQGIELKDSAQVWSGSSATCSQPATMRFEAVRDATPEWRTIRAEGVKKGSARYSLLISEMNDRIRAACQRAAEEQGRDCVVSAGDIKTENGLPVRDITDEVVGKLESGQPAS